MPKPRYNPPPFKATEVDPCDLAYLTFVTAVIAGRETTKTHDDVTVPELYRQLTAKLRLYHDQERGMMPLSKELSLPSKGEKYDCSMCRNFLIMQSLLLGRCKTYKEVAAMWGISPVRASQIVGKQIRWWQHPGRYLDFFKIYIRPGGIEVYTRDLVNDEDDDGFPQYVVTRHRSIGEALRHVDQWLNRFHTSLNLPVRTQRQDP